MLNLDAFTNSALVIIYNSVAEIPLNTKKFKDHSVAVERVGALLNAKELAILGTVEDYQIVKANEVDLIVAEPEVVNFEVNAVAEAEMESEANEIEAVAEIELEPEVVTDTVEIEAPTLLAQGYGENCNPNDTINEVSGMEPEVHEVEVVAETEMGPETIIEEAKPIDELGDLSTQGTGIEQEPVAAGQGQPMEEILTEPNVEAVEVTSEEALALDAAADAKVHKRREGTKLEQLYTMLNDPKGVTNEEAKTAFGWPAISIKTMASKLEWPLQMRKEGREKRYYLASVELPPAPEVEAVAPKATAKKGGKVVLTLEEYHALLNKANALEAAIETIAASHTTQADEVIEQVTSEEQVSADMEQNAN